MSLLPLINFYYSVLYSNIETNGPPELDDSSYSVLLNKTNYFSHMYNKEMDLADITQCIEIMVEEWKKQQNI